MSFSFLPDVIIQEEISCYLNFTESINLRKTCKYLSETYSYHHDPRLDYQTAFKKAVYVGNIEAVKSLLAVPYVDPNFFHNYAVRVAVHFNYVDVLKILLDNGRVDPSNNYNDALISAARVGSGAILMVLLSDDHVDPSVDGNYVFIRAARYGLLDAVNLLLADRRVDPTVQENIAIREASYHGYTDVVKALLNDTRIDPTVEDNYAIRIACYLGHVGVVAAILEGNGNVDPNIALLEVSEFNSANHTQIIKLLLPHVNATSSFMTKILYNTAKVSNDRAFIMVLNDCRTRIAKSDLIRLKIIATQNRSNEIVKAIKIYGGISPSFRFLSCISNHSVP